MEKNHNRKRLTGVVVGNKMAKTLVVEVTKDCRHPVYGKVVKRRKKFYAHHNGENNYEVGQQVTIVESRPISKLKKWRIAR